MNIPVILRFTFIPVSSLVFRRLDDPNKAFRSIHNWRLDEHGPANGGDLGRVGTGVGV